ncbi:MAG: hypothetical protein ABI651_21440 [Verrucomicrobiota bacterium]
MIVNDKPSFNVRRSPLGWVTPFEFKITTPHPSFWKRYVYYCFIWKKRPETRLEMLWRYEQWYYGTGGWTNPEMLWNSRTGLVYFGIMSVVQRNATKPIDASNVRPRETRLQTG